MTWLVRCVGKDRVKEYVGSVQYDVWFIEILSRVIASFGKPCATRVQKKITFCGSSHNRRPSTKNCRTNTTPVSNCRWSRRSFWTASVIPSVRRQRRIVQKRKFASAARAYRCANSLVFVYTSVRLLQIIRTYVTYNNINYAWPDARDAILIDIRTVNNRTVLVKRTTACTFLRFIKRSRDFRFVFNE